MTAPVTHEIQGEGLAPSRPAIQSALGNLEGTLKQEETTKSQTNTLGQRLEKIHYLLDELTSSPSSHDVMEVAMAVATSLDLSQKDDTPLVWLIIVGVPGSDKTQRVLTLKKCEQTTFIDTLTPNCFASGYGV
jgi:hypothetical protein